MTILLQADDLGYQVATSEGPLDILKHIHLSIEQGESVAIVGASGSGKSTLLGLLAGLDTPTHGDLWLAGHKLTGMDEEARALIRAEYVGFVFQTFQLLPGLTALENVMLPSELRHDPQAKMTAKTFLERVHLGHRLQHYPRQLSGGEQQRVAIARAFASQPKILFADEPTGSLDTSNGHHISNLLFDLNTETATTLVLVTHEPALAARCQRRIHIDAGQVIKVEHSSTEASPRDLYTDEASSETQSSGKLSSGEQHG
jgi:putative ABC transport system ATP-binding protein